MKAALRISRASFSPSAQEGALDRRGTAVKPGERHRLGGSGYPAGRGEDCIFRSAPAQGLVPTGIAAGPLRTRRSAARNCPMSQSNSILPPGTARPSKPCARAGKSGDRGRQPGVARLNSSSSTMPERCARLARAASSPASPDRNRRRLHAVRAPRRQARERYPGQLIPLPSKLIKDWRTDRYLRRREAMMLVAGPPHHAWC